MSKEKRADKGIRVRYPSKNGYLEALTEIISSRESMIDENSSDDEVAELEFNKRLLSTFQLLKESAIKALDKRNKQVWEAQKRITELEEGLTWLSDQTQSILSAAIKEYPNQRLKLEETKFLLNQKVESLLTKQP